MGRQNLNLPDKTKWTLCTIHATRLAGDISADVTALIDKVSLVQYCTLTAVVWLYEDDSHSDAHVNNTPLDLVLCLKLYADFTVLSKYIYSTFH